MPSALDLGIVLIARGGWQIAMGAFVSYFFSGFIMGRIPFPLSPSFRIMLQVCLCHSDQLLSPLSHTRTCLPAAPCCLRPSQLPAGMARQLCAPYTIPVPRLCT